MGNYVFDADALLEARDPRLDHDGLQARHGRRHRARLRTPQRGRRLRLQGQRVPGATDRDRGYWRDVGTMRSYYDAHMDLVSPLPVFNLYNAEWPIYTSYGPQPPVKLAKGADGTDPVADEALLSPGVVVSGGQVRRSVLSPAARVEQGAVVEDSVLMNGVHIGERAVVRNAILDKEVVVPAGRRDRGRPRARPRSAGSWSRTGSPCSARASPSPTRDRGNPARRPHVRLCMRHDVSEPSSRRSPCWRSAAAARRRPRRPRPARQPRHPGRSPVPRSSADHDPTAAPRRPDSRASPDTPAQQRAFSSSSPGRWCARACAAALRRPPSRAGRRLCSAPSSRAAATVPPGVDVDRRRPGGVTDRGPARSPARCPSA